MKKQLVVLTVLSLLAAGASATLVQEYANSVSFGKNEGGNIFTGVAADAGDVIVVTAASSKSYSNEYSLVASGGGAYGSQVGYWEDKNAGVSYWTVTAPGTFTLDVAADTLGTFDTYAGFVIGSDVPGYSVTELAVQTTFNNPLFANGTGDPLAIVTVTNDYGTIASDGFFVEAANAFYFSGFPANADNIYTNGGNSRGAISGDFLAGDLQTIWNVQNNEKNSRFAGVAFGEVIPEPATMGLISIAGLGLLFIRRRFMM